MVAGEEQRILNKRWVRAVMALLFLGIAYGFASLAIDSGSLFEYALTIFFFVWAIKTTVRTVHKF